MVFGILPESDGARWMVIGLGIWHECDVEPIIGRTGGGRHPHLAAALLNSVNPKAVEKWINFDAINSCLKLFLPHKFPQLFR